MTRRTASAAALSVARFEGSPTYGLAEVVHRETEIARAVAAAKYKEQFGDEPEFINAFSPHPGSFDRSKSTPWFEYLDIQVLDRCADALKISVDSLLDRIVKELQPDNWEVLFWQRAYYRAIESGLDAKVQMKKLTAKFEAQKLANAKAGGHASNEKQYGKAKEFVCAEWAVHKGLYDGNKSAFARAYVDRVRRECDVKVTHKTIASSWLEGR
jgi:hypothetical protein